MLPSQVYLCCAGPDAHEKLESDIQFLRHDEKSAHIMDQLACHSYWDGASRSSRSFRHRSSRCTEVLYNSKGINRVNIVKNGCGKEPHIVLRWWRAARAPKLQPSLRVVWWLPATVNIRNSKYVKDGVDGYTLQFKCSVVGANRFFAQCTRFEGTSVILLKDTLDGPRRCSMHSSMVEPIIEQLQLDETTVFLR
ncbi:hypothetical protein GN244_ATG06396 [Phytophthora infestans]|uniref:Uncharacterized protein n=1 Tax=Phytophthora infestans TaxID=4787 RepID=A0A833SXQ2_PHYIN|nr:hypothetical protein GN244_ATG06396 [Phytophthora infestans]